ncbi:MAG: UDP-3-O-(3-hydroxymyristoyl)glucosamine N-acyltransferase [Rhodobacteraceae bacterium]|nr:UDP-3-O-(3-hydroxymyristoyl)glucosamine N-acyltransferase [Paracoccaceae bacterium]
MPHTIQEIASALGLEAVGDTSIIIDGANEPAEASARDIALAMKPTYAEGLANSRARVAMVWDGADWQAMGLEAAILTGRSRYAMAGLSQIIDPGQHYPSGISPSAHVDPTAEIGEGVTIGPFTMVGARARIGAGSVLGPQCYVGADVVLGAGARLHSGARLMARVQAGDRLIVQPNAVIGGDGFSFVTPEVSGVEKARKTLGDQGDVTNQSWTRIHTLGSVTLGSDVEVGACSTIDSGTIRDTRIGDGTKIDNQVMIGHNCIIGRDCLLCGHVGLAGSVTIGNNVVLGGKTGVSDNTSIGDNAICGAATVVLSKVPAGRVMLGYPAVKMEQHLEMYKHLRRLPRLAGQVAELQKAVSKDETSD